MLATAAAVLQTSPETLTIRDGAVADASGPRMTLKELARIAWFRGNELPPDVHPEFAATRHYRVTDQPFVYTNGAMAAHVEVDPDTGEIRLLDHWVVEDVGTVLNPMLVDEQIRGGVCRASAPRCSRNAFMTARAASERVAGDYLVPMAGEMPDITIAHVVTPTSSSALGAKGAGEAGTAGAPAAVMGAVNDALRPLGARLDTLP